MMNLLESSHADPSPDSHPDFTLKPDLSPNHAFRVSRFLLTIRTSCEKPHPEPDHFSTLYISTGRA